MFARCLRAGAWLVASLAVLAGLAYLYYRSLEIDQIPKANPQATVQDLDWLQRGLARGERRGKILAVVSSTARMAQGAKKAGYELTELSRAYYVFMANGYEVDIASPAGGTPPARIDADDMGEADHAFMNDKVAQARLARSLRLADVDAHAYAAVYFVGGKGAMFDFPGNPDIARIVRTVAAKGVIGAVCHGPAALAGLTLADGSSLLAGRRVAAFSNAEELFLRKDARAVLPFMLEERLRLAGARVESGPMFLERAVTDGPLVTGQNPWSTWAVAERMIAALGHRPVPRPATAEENSVRLLATYRREGLAAASAEQAATPRFDKMLLLMHALIAGMQWRVLDAFELQRLARS